MVWAIDLDDGTLIEALGSNLSRNKSRVFEQQIHSCNLGTGYNHDEL